MADNGTGLTMPERMVRVETQMKEVKGDIREIKTGQGKILNGVWTILGGVVVGLVLMIVQAFN